MCFCAPSAVQGSSPLTRGKRGEATGLREDAGLIPAHAGKTCRSRQVQPGVSVHPHSCGENSPASGVRTRFQGSSPLTRGKHVECEQIPRLQGLIPTHAGKTNPSPGAVSRRTAHPRSCGENPIFALILKCGCGSSPLIRGKLRAGGELDGPARLIPAHAGKTPCPASSHSSRRAHPRSCGENNPDLRFYRADRSDLGKP